MSEQPSGQNKQGCLVWVIVIVIFLSIIGIIGNSSGDSYSADDLSDAQVKRLNGEKITREDEIMLDGFDDWKADQDKYED